jgi:beclin
MNYPQERKSLYDQVSSKGNKPIYKRSIPAPSDAAHLPHRHLNGNTEMSFIEITQSQALPTEQERPSRQHANGQLNDDDQDFDRAELYSSKRDQVEDLFAILSSHSDIDHPICQECTAMLLSHYTTRLGSANREREAYAGFLKSTQQAASAEAQKPQSTRPSETSIFEHLEQTEADLRRLEDEIAALEIQLQQEERDEQAYWISRNATDDNLYEVTTNLTFLQDKRKYDSQQLERLQRTNVYNDTFCIGHDGYFGTINGLRLGRLPNQNVEWSEINAAWGQTLLLLATVAERLRFSFQGYRLRPQGSTSRIEKLEYPQQTPDLQRQSTGGRDRGLNSAAANPEPKITLLDLFSSGDMAIGRLLNHRKFDGGMVAFLDCLAQIGEHVERTSGMDMNVKPSLRNAGVRKPPSKRVLPYSIEGDKIDGISIKLGAGFSQDENFTKACKYALTCCKFLLAHVSNLESQKEV